jgi:MFS family permease
MVSIGCGHVSSSLFVKPLETAMGWSRTELMAGFTVYLAFTAITAPLAGRMVDRYGARVVISLGALLAGIGLALLSQMNSLWHYYAGYAILGTGLSAVGQVSSSYVVSQWFSRRRGRAIGIMSMGIGFSGIVFPPLVGVYLIPHFGWSSTYLFLLMITVGLTVPLSLFVIRTRPAELGLFPDGMEAPESVITTDAKPLPSEGLSPKMALATPAFWLIAASVTLTHTHLGIVQNQIPHFDDIGFPVSIAASAFSITAALSAFGTFFFGWLCDRIPAKFASAIGLGLMALGISIFINVDAGSPTGLIWLYASVLGLGMGNWMPTMSMLTSTTFGLASYGAIFGTMSFFQNFGAATSPLVAGYLYDSMGTYHWAFIIILALIVLAIPLVLAVRRPATLVSPTA